MEAEQGGAGRVELCVELAQGGLTPPVDMVEKVLGCVRIPARVMICENPSYKTPDAAELATLLDLTKQIGRLPVDGIVIGFATPEGEPDFATLRYLAEAAPGVRITFHRIFESFRDPLGVAAQLKAIRQVDRILLCQADWDALAATAAPGIQLIAGGGLRQADFRRLLETTGVREFHTGRAVRKGQVAEGQVEASAVRALIAAIEASR